jgi:NAD(P)-dependent dehydrogenase (short-subunit alcohol dehydrogenase family)
MSKPTALIVGGTSGLGLEMAKALTSDHHVLITGRKNPGDERLLFHSLMLNSMNKFGDYLDVFIRGLPNIDLFVYAAGFYQEGRISDLADQDISDMLNVGLLAPALLLQRLLKKQRELSGFIAITSSSQWIPSLVLTM